MTLLNWLKTRKHIIETIRFHRNLQTPGFTTQRYMVTVLSANPLLLFCEKNPLLDNNIQLPSKGHSAQFKDETVARCFLAKKNTAYNPNHSHA